MACGGLLVSLALAALSAVLPQIETALSQGPQDSLWVKQLVGIIGLSVMIGAPLTGWLIDRFSMKKVLVVCSLVVALAGTAGLYLSNLPILVVSRFVMGAAAGGIATCSMTLINTRLTGNVRARWMGVHVSVYMASSIIYFPVAGMLGELGWRWPFALYLLGIPLAAIVAFSFDDAPAPSPAADPVKVEADPPLRLIDWFPFRFAALGFIVGCFLYQSAIYMPFMFRDIGVNSPRTMSLILMITAVVPSSFAMLYGRAQRHMSMSTIFILCFAFASVGGTIVVFARDVLTAALGICVFGVGLGMMIPNLMTSLGTQVAAAHQGRAIGIVKAAQYLSAPLVTLLVEPFAQHFGAVAAFASIALLGLVMALAFGYQRLLARPPKSVDAAIK